MRIPTLAVLAISAMGFASAAPAAIGPAPVDPTPAELEEVRLQQTAFEPIASLAAPGRELRRVSFGDIYNENGQPGVTIEKMANGEIHMKVTSNNARVIDEAILKPEAWTAITSKDAAGLAPRKKGAAPKEICMGASVVVEAIVDGKVVRREGEICNGANDAHTFEYARLIADVAQKSIPRCAGHVLATREASWTLRDCLRRSLVARYSINPYNFASGNNSEAFESYALSSWNNVNDELLASLQTPYVE